MENKLGVAITVVDSHGKKTSRLWYIIIARNGFYTACKLRYTLISRKETQVENIGFSRSKQQAGYTG